MTRIVPPNDTPDLSIPWTRCCSRLLRLGAEYIIRCLCAMKISRPGCKHCQLQHIAHQSCRCMFPPKWWSEEFCSHSRSSPIQPNAIQRLLLPSACDQMVIKYSHLYKRNASFNHGDIFFCHVMLMELVKFIKKCANLFYVVMILLAYSCCSNPLHTFEISKHVHNLMYLCGQFVD